MSASNTTLRLITVLFILAGILLLRKPVFGQAPVDGVASLYSNASATMPNIHLVRIDDSRHFIMFDQSADQPAAFDKAVQTLLKPATPVN